MFMKILPGYSYTSALGYPDLSLHTKHTVQNYEEPSQSCQISSDHHGK